MTRKNVDACKCKQHGEKHCLNAKHTRGPWSVDEFDGRIYIVAADDPMFYVTEMCDPETDPEGSYPEPAERIANAQLIATAPELLTALNQLAVRFPLEFKTTLKKCSCLQFEDNLHCRHIYAMQVIAKAGEGNKP